VRENLSIVKLTNFWVGFSLIGAKFPGSILFFPAFSFFRDFLNPGLRGRASSPASASAADMIIIFKKKLA
jgi:hypothetical protein